MSSSVNMSIVERVKKLLALSKSDNPNEASAAMAAAQNLIRKHQLSVDEVERETGAVQERPQSFRTDPIISGKRIPRWKRRLFIILAKANGCSPFASGAKFGEQHLYMIGRPSDVELVRYLFAYSVSEIVRMSKKECKGRGSKYKDQWLHGAVSGIRQKLEGPADTAALVVVDKRTSAAFKLAEELYEVDKKPQVTTAVFTNGEAMMSGMAAGRLVDVSRDGRLGDVSGKVKALP